MILIIYTTEYREGGLKFERVAETMAKEKKSHFENMRSESINSKRDLKRIINTILLEGKSIQELHFIGHSGMYGPMFGTVKYPEQFSPFEWKNFTIPFSEKGKEVTSSKRGGIFLSKPYLYKDWVPEKA